MKSVKGYNATIIIMYLVAIFGLLTSFYIKSNKNLSFLLEAPRIQILNIEKYDFVTDENNYLEMDIGEEFTDVYITANEIKYNDVIIKDGTITLTIGKEISLNGEFYKINYEDKTFRKIVWSEELKELTFEMGFAGIMGLAFVGIGITWFFLIYYKNMDVLRKHRRIKTLISIVIVTIIMLIISFITNQIYQIFVVGSGVYILHYLHWIVHRKRNGLPLSEEIVQKVEITNG